VKFISGHKIPSSPWYSWLWVISKRHKVLQPDLDKRPVNDFFLDIIKGILRHKISLKALIKYNLRVRFLHITRTVSFEVLIGCLPLFCKTNCN
jgi:hypothetical protein